MSLTRHRCDKCDASAFATNASLPEGWQHHRSTMNGSLLTVCTSCDEASTSTGRSDSEASASDDQLRLFVERVERLEEEVSGLRMDISDVYKEMKSQGYDAKIVKLIIKDRKLAPHDRAERDAILEVYRASLGQN